MKSKKVVHYRSNTRLIPQNTTKGNAFFYFFTVFKSYLQTRAIKLISSSISQSQIPLDIYQPFKFRVAVASVAEKKISAKLIQIVLTNQANTLE